MTWVFTGCARRQHCSIERPVECLVPTECIQEVICRALAGLAGCLVNDNFKHEVTGPHLLMLCTGTYLWWSARPDKVDTEPYYELPLPMTQRRLNCQLSDGLMVSHSLQTQWPVEQGRIRRPKVPM